MSARPRRINLRTNTYTDVADFVQRAMRGEPGRFGVYVAQCGTTNVCRLKHKDHNPRPASELAGVFTQDAPINVIEDALLARKREMSAMPAQAVAA